MISPMKRRSAEAQSFRSFSMYVARFSAVDPDISFCARKSTLNPVYVWFLSMVSVLLALITSSSATEFDPEHLLQLFTGDDCVACDFVGTNLSIQNLLGRNLKSTDVSYAKLEGADSRSAHRFKSRALVNRQFYIVQQFADVDFALNYFRFFDHTAGKMRSK